MRRRLFALASAISLLLCLATAVLWGWTLRRDYACIGWADERRGEIDIALRNGDIAFIRSMPILRFVDESPRESDTLWDTNECSTSSVRRGLVRNPGTWWVQQRLPNIDYHTRRVLQTSKQVTMVSSFSQLPIDPRMKQSFFESRWQWRGLEYRDQVVVYNGYDGFAYGHEFWVPRLFVGSFLIAIFSALPAFGLLKPLLRLRRRSAGLCPVCSFNLTGNTSGVCPECGTPVPKEPAAKSPGPA